MNDYYSKQIVLLLLSIAIILAGIFSVLAVGLFESI